MCVCVCVFEAFSDTVSEWGVGCIIFGNELSSRGIKRYSVPFSTYFFMIM